MDKPLPQPVAKHPGYILPLSCLDQRGIVHAVSEFLAEHDCNILDSAQYGDTHGESRTNLFFMRVHFVDEPYNRSSPQDFPA